MQRAGDFHPGVTFITVEILLMLDGIQLEWQPIGEIGKFNGDRYGIRSIFAGSDGSK
ncbi:hypothetical protein [Virgibacillus sp. YIM 98842]|uniref:hypothetical protein n=1 Tax=Virgibacillus sp. YIM 98842 TaxID=2663533 RepID=UPI0013D9AE05|nr:hypothetical protein [Virgibacillus sp. YIM 98842]